MRFRWTFFGTRRRGGRTLLRLECLEARLTPASPTLTPVRKDATLFSEGVNFSDGGGGSIYVGKVGTKDPANPGGARRALVAFDLSQIPAGSLITGATLTLDLLKVPATGGGIVDISLYRLDQDWGEGKTVSSGQGTQADAGDATWSSAHYQQQAWTQPNDPTGGGTFEATASAVTAVDGTRDPVTRVPRALGPKTWSDPRMVADLQAWLDHPSTNFGWLIKSKEDVLGTALELGSRQNADPAAVPLLDVAFTPPPSIVTTSLSPWTVNRPYAPQTVQVTGGDRSYMFTPVGPINGLSLSATGQVTGTPTPSLTGAPAYDINLPVKVTDGRGVAAPRGTVTVHVNPPLSLGSFAQVGTWTANRTATGTLQVIGGTLSESNPPTIAGLPALTITGDTATTVGGVTTNTFTFTCLPTSDANVTIQVNDHGGASAARSYPVSVVRGSPRTFVVNTAADLPALRPNDPACDAGGDISLRSAIEASEDDANTAEPQHDVILLPAGDYALDSTLEISVYADIRNEPGVSPDQVHVFNSQQMSSAFSQSLIRHLSGVASITGVVLFPKPAPNLLIPLQAIENHAALTLTNCTVEYFGTSAVVCGDSSDLEVNGCTFSNNSTVQSGSGQGAAIWERSGTMTVTDSSFLSDLASLGGAVHVGDGYTSPEANFTGCSFVSNLGVQAGGAIYNRGSLTVSGSDFRLNSVLPNFGQADPDPADFQGGDGGAVFNSAAGTFVSSANTYMTNSATAHGGAILNEGASPFGLTARGDTYEGNTADQGGAIANGGAMTVSGSTFRQNHSLNPVVGIGGAIINAALTRQAAVAVFDNCVFADNAASQLGGAVVNDDHLTVRNSLFRDNHAVEGGAAFNHGFLTITNSTLSGNAATDEGGALWNDTELTADGCTVAFNSAFNGGGGVLSYSQLTTLTDDIVAGNSLSNRSGFPNDVDGTGVSPTSGYNVVGADLTGSLAAGANGNQLGISAAAAGLTFALGYYGGATPTYALKPPFGFGIGKAGPVAALSDDAPLPGTGLASITVGNGSAFAAADLAPLSAGAYVTVQVDGEQMAVTAVQTHPDGSATLTVARRANGTAGATHAAGAGVWLASDQRGITRPPDVRADVGSFQTQPQMLINTSADEDGEGLLTLRAALHFAEQVDPFDGDSVDFDPAVFATPQTIRLESDLTVGGPLTHPSITFDAPRAGLTLAGAVANDGSMSGLNVAVGARLAVVGDLRVSAPLQVAGELDVYVNGGRLEVGNGPLTLSGTLDVAGSLDVTGRLDVVPGGLLQIDTRSLGATVEGTLTVLGRVNIEPGSSTPGGVQFPGGTLTVVNDLEVGVNGLLTDGGSLVIGGPSNHAALVNDYGTVTVTAPFLDGAGHFQPGGSLDLYGELRVKPGQLGLPSGVLNDFGQLTVQDGGTLRAGGTVIVGSPDGWGTIDVYGTVLITGAIPGLSPAGRLSVEWKLIIHPGDAGAAPGLLDDFGQLTLTPFGQVIDQGTVTAESGSAVDVAGAFWVQGAASLLTVENAATLTVSGNAELRVFAGGLANVRGALPATEPKSRVRVESGGTLRDGGQVTIGNALDVSASAAGTGTFLVAGGSFSLTAQATATVGGAFHVLPGSVASVGGSFTVAAGGAVEDDGSFLLIGSAGVLTVAAAGDDLPAATFTTASNAGQLSLGFGARAAIAGSLFGDGNLTLAFGSSLTDTGLVQFTGLGVGGPGLGFGASSFTVGAGGLCTVLGAAMATVDGDFDVAGGTLNMLGSMTARAVTVEQDGTVRGAGTINGPVTVIRGTVAPGFAGIGTLGTGDLTLTSGGTLNAVLTSPAPLDSGRVNVTGSVALDGANLDLTTTSDFVGREGDLYFLVNNDGSDPVSGQLHAGAGADALVPGTPLLDRCVLSTNFFDSGRQARISYGAGPGGNSVGLLLSPLAPTIDSSPSDPSVSADATFKFSDADAGVSYLTTLDQGTPALASGSATYAGLAAGPHTFTVVAFGHAGFVSTAATYTWTVGAPPAITSALSATFQAGSAGSLTVTTTGFPKPTLSETGALPPGLAFVDRQDGTAVLSGTPAAGTFGTFPIVITASNGIAPDATQAFTLTVSNLALLTAGGTLSVPDYLPLSTLPALPSGATPITPDVTSFTVSRVAPGDSATVVLQLSAGTLQPGVPYAYFKFVPGRPAADAWVRTNPGVATFDPDAQTITLRLTDDGVVADGDEGPANDGSIVDPGLPVALATPEVSVSDIGGVYDGSAFPAVASVAGVAGVNATTLEGVAPTLDYQRLDASGQVVANLNAQAPTSAGSYRVTATFPGSASYTAAQASATFTIAPATPTVTWPTPAPITYAMPLGADQLDATADIPGTFTYSPAAGVLLPPGSRTLSVTFKPADGTDYVAVTARAPLKVLGPGVAVLGAALYVVGGAGSNDQIRIDPAGASATGSTGLRIVATLDHVPTTAVFRQTFTAITVVGFGGNINVQLAGSLTLPTSVTLGDGNDDVRLGDGANLVNLGDGNDQVRAGDGNNTITVGGGNDHITVGDGDNVVRAGDGNVTIRAGDGNNLIVAGRGHHTVQAGNGTDLLIDGNVRSTQAGDTLRQVLSSWTADVSHDRADPARQSADAGDTRNRLSVTSSIARANTLTAGSSLDWFWAFYGRDRTSRKVRDRLDEQDAGQPGRVTLW